MKRELWSMLQALRGGWPGLVFLLLVALVAMTMEGGR